MPRVDSTPKGRSTLRPSARTGAGTLWTAIVLVLCGLVLLLAPGAWAGQFHLYSCTDPVTQAPLPTDGWTETPGLSINPENTCSKGNGISTSLIPQFPNSTSSWTFSAPTGTAIIAATLYREGSMNSRARSFWAAPENVVSEADDFDLCQGVAGPPEETYCNLGNVGIYRECKPPTLCGPRPYAPNDTLIVPSSHLPAHQLAFDLTCLMQGCYGYESLRSADIVLQQIGGPTATGTGGSLTDSSPLHGVADIEVTATDPASGVFQAIFQSNGRTVARQVIDANGGKCEPYSEEPDGSEIFVHTQPCPLAVSNVDVPFNTAQLSDGPQQLTVLVSDAAGNTTSVLSRAVVVENSGQYLVRVQREQQEQALAARGACNAECDDHASLHSTNAKLARRPYAQSGTTLDGQLVNHAGSPMKGALLELRQQASYLGAQKVVLATTTTNVKGDWKFRVPKGPSRVLTVGYRSRSQDPTFATQVQFHESVAAGVRLSAPARAHPGRAFAFRGHLAGGYIPRGGALVSLEIYYGGEWREIALLRSSRRGAFAYRYTFAAIGAATYGFRAQVPSTVGFPFASGASPSTYIHLAGRGLGAPETQAGHREDLYGNAAL
jgi:hypothetical protein